MKLSGSMSRKTGTACSYKMQFVDATKLNDDVITSSSGPIPKARTHKWSAEVPLLTATACLRPINEANCVSNFGTLGPKLSIPDRKTSVTY